MLIYQGELEEAARDLAAAVRLASARLATDQATENDAYNVAVYRAASGDFEQAYVDLRLAIELLPNRWLMRDAIDDFCDLSSVPGMDTAGIARLIELLDGTIAALSDAGDG